MKFLQSYSSEIPNYKYFDDELSRSSLNAEFEFIF